MAQTFATGYYHVLVDLLPRMIIAKELFLDRDNTALLIIQSDFGGAMKPYVSQLLALLRVPKNQIRPYEVQADDGGGSTDAARLAVDKLIVIDWRWEDNSNATVQGTAEEQPRVSVDGGGRQSLFLSLSACLFL